MNPWLRRIRGAIGMGLAWGAAWFAAGLIMMLGLLITTGSTGADVPYPLGFGALGFLAGVTFSGVVGLVGRRRRFDEMSLPRFVGWGAGGGFLFSVVFVALVALTDNPGFFSNLVVLGPLFAAAGAGCAAGALILARKAQGGASLGAGDDLGVGSIAGSEVQPLPGPGGDSSREA